MRMKKNKVIFYSLLGAIAAGHAFAGIRVGNLSRNYAGTYKNVTGLEQQYYNSIGQNQADLSAQQDLPISGAYLESPDRVQNNDGAAGDDIERLNACSRIYPDGEFVWDRPTLGRGAGGKPTCVAVVEMRALGANGNSEYTVVARGKLAAGDMVNCNISDFPTSTYLPEIVNVVFPADKAPTREDVISVLNQEQKNKAGLKIAAATLAAGIAGNMVGKQELGSDALFGTNSEKLKSTAAGAAIGAALMTASTYSGKVAGDVILHTGVNAAAGGIIGNMMASGDAVLRIEKCKDGGVETTCLWGTVVEIDKNDGGLGSDKQAFYDLNKPRIIICDVNGSKYENCKENYQYVFRYIVDENGKKITPGDLVTASGVIAEYNSLLANMQEFRTKDGVDEIITGQGGLYKAVVEKYKTEMPAVIVGFKDSAFGIKAKDWYNWRSANGSSAHICLRDSSGNPYNCNGATDDKGKVIASYDINDFTPVSLDASDGGVVDFSNKARLGSTLKGAGIGGAIGGFAGYQGAQSDIEERFVQATREYNDSLEKFYCGSGRRFMTFYNDTVTVPTMKQ